MTRTFEGEANAEGLHIGVAVTAWNQTITDRLLDGARGRLEEINVGEITVLRVPGALELPLAAQHLIEAGCDGVVALGTIVKGDTDHYDIVVRESSSGIARVALDTGKPVSNGILAVHQYQHAVDRAGRGDSNRGAEAAEAVVITIRALQALAG